MRNRDPRLRQERRIEFLGEQDGVGERELKASLQATFRHHPEVLRAYLARIGFSPAAEPSVALCLACKDADRSRIMDDVGQVFGLLFSSENHLDIVFLNEEQEDDLKRVCAPFFDASAQ
jgi:hypothetical protein